ncbi:hypothetical protein [Psychrosphaera algicola]|uniref:Lipoprotein n=1 Tax=Psychrosphaera algicola TaxID=3023714 RepID=A0ABT5FGF3_9GAMM|nr:hypothetical protein [Psychrosphaera sp. G1-22]MDC2889807.1 hypothetical protein [Psychrosphaera sp. G1-22]
MKHLRNALVVIVALSAVACSNKSMYQFGKNYQKTSVLKKRKQRGS